MITDGRTTPATPAASWRISQRYGREHGHGPSDQLHIPGPRLAPRGRVSTTTSHHLNLEGGFNVD